MCAIRIEDEYSDATPANADYPEGSFKNETTPGALDGTPFEKKWPNDIYGFFQKLLDVADITPSGDPDTVLASDYYDALITILTAIVGGYQPLDDDLTSIAGLSTTSYGRALLTLANQAALQTAIGFGVTLATFAQINSRCDGVPADSHYEESGGKTITASDTNILNTGNFNVTEGDYFTINGFIECTKGGVSGHVTLTVALYAATGHLEFCYDNVGGGSGQDVMKKWAVAGEEIKHNFSAEIKADGTGSVAIGLKMTSTNSDCTMVSGHASLAIVWRKKQ
jgi:hypothetical protein